MARAKQPLVDAEANACIIPTRKSKRIKPNTTERIKERPAKKKAVDGDDQGSEYAMVNGTSPLGHDSKRVLEKKASPAVISASNSKAYIGE
jgi:hypothetical protein